MSHLTSRDPQPATNAHERALLGLLGAASLLVVAAFAGVAGASALFGGGATWPSSPTWVQALIGLISGDPGSGYPSAAAKRIPGDGVVYACVAVVEVLTVAAALVGAVVVARFRRPGGARRGMATRGEAAAVLGRSRLWTARRILRPDLYARGGRR